MSLVSLPAVGTPLSVREVQVLRLVGDGKTNPQIATALRISPDTVRSHMQRISAKLGVSGRAAMVTAGFRDGWLRLPEDVLLSQATALMQRRTQLRERAT